MGFTFWCCLFNKIIFFFLYTDYLKNLLEESADYRDTQGKCLFKEITANVPMFPDFK